MKKLIELTVLERIVAYQVANRQIGHTYAMLNGVDHHCLIVVGDWAQKNYLEHRLNQYGFTPLQAKNCVITIQQIKNGILETEKGRPLVIDNIGLWGLAMDVSEHRRKLLLREYEKMERTNG